MEKDIRQLDKLKKLYELLKDDTISPKQVEQFLTLLIQIVKTTKDDFTKEFSEISRENQRKIYEAIQIISEKHHDILEEFNKKTSKQDKDFKAKIDRMEQMFQDVLSIEIRDGKDGVNPDPADVVPLVLEKILPLELKGEDIVDEINDLPTNKDKYKIDKKHIKGLEDFHLKKDFVYEINRLKQQTSFLISRGGGSSGAISDITGFITAGTNVTLGGTGTLADPYVVNASGGSGDFVGPSSATDNAVVRFDSTTGKLGQNSVVLISDTGAITGAIALTVSSVNGIDYNPGSDTNNDIITVGVTGTPTVSWNEAMDRFSSNKGWLFGDTILPLTDDGAAIGSGTKQFSDLFLASGALVNWGNGDVVLTHTSGKLSFNKKIAVNATTGTDDGISVTAGGAGTNGAFFHAHNGGGDAYIGLEDSAGSLLGVGGAYSLNLIHFGNYPVAIGNNGAAKMTIAATTGITTFAADVIVPDEAYDATAWNGSLEVPTKNAIRDKFETLTGGGNVSNTGTPVNNQVAVWTSATVIEGDAALTFDTTTNTLTSGTVIANEGYILSSGATPFIDLYDTDVSDYAGLEMRGTTELRIYAPSGAKIRLMNDLDLQGVYVSGSVVPIVHDNYDLGSATKAWAGLYLGPDENIHFDNIPYIYQGVGADNSLYLTAPSGHQVRIFDAASSISAILDTGSLATSNKTFTFPNTSGTFALTSNPTDITVPDEAYGGGWNGSLEVPTKNAIYDKIAAISIDSTYYLVAANDATAKEKILADYQCDGTADEVQINLAIAAVKASGGKVILSSGTFNCAATVAIIGDAANDIDNPETILHGSGIDATTLSMASNISGITLTQEPKYDIGFLTIVVKGTADGIKQTAGTERGNWQSHIHDIFIKTDFTTHNAASWGINMESPFRMRFTNIEMNGVANGIWLKSHTDSFNPGNLTVDRIFIDLWDDASVASAIGIKLSVLNSSSTGHFNLTAWNRIDIHGGSNLTSSIGIKMVGATGSYGECRQHSFNNLNIEDVKTGFELTDSSDNTFSNVNYTRILAGGTVFKLNSESLNNKFENTYLDSNNAGATFVVIDDAGNDAAQPNIFDRIVGFSSGTTTLNGTITAATVITHMQLTEGGPTIDSDLTDRNNRLTFQDVLVTDEAYDATSWNGNLEVPTKNAVRDKVNDMFTNFLKITVSSSAPSSPNTNDLWYDIS